MEPARTATGGEWVEQTLDVCGVSLDCVLGNAIARLHQCRDLVAGIKGAIDGPRPANEAKDKPQEMRSLSNSCTSVEYLASVLADGLSEVLARLVS